MSETNTYKDTMMNKTSRSDNFKKPKIVTTPLPTFVTLCKRCLYTIFADILGIMEFSRKFKMLMNLNGKAQVGKVQERRNQKENPSPKTEVGTFLCCVLECPFTHQPKL